MRRAPGRWVRGVLAAGLAVACAGQEFSAAGTGAGGSVSRGRDGGAARDAANGVGGKGGSGGNGANGGGSASAGGSTGAGGATTTLDGGLLSPPDAGASDAGCSPTVALEDGVYVDVRASRNGDGSVAAPLGTLAAGVARAFKDGVGHVYLAPGTYTGLSITGFSQALTIEGGFVPAAGDARVWTRDCRAGARADTIVAAPSASVPGLVVESNQATIHLARLTVLSFDQAIVQNGIAGSVFGIIVRGADLSPTLTLDDVYVGAGRGADAVAPSATPSSGNRACDGLTYCAANGVDGAAAAPGTGAELGKFGGTGYAPADGATGLHGKDGADGTIGGSGGQCTNCAGSCQGTYPLCTVSAGKNVSGGSGACGCGGLGGPPGAPGKSGGASVGLLVAGDASVAASNSQIKSGRGGDASAGADGGQGGTGTPGSKGASPMCGTVSGTKCSGSAGTSCSIVTVTEQCTAPGGSAGGAGHRGGAGARGGHGFGGPSFAVVTVSKGAFTRVKGNLDFGSSGKSGSGTVPEDNAGALLSQ